MSPTLITALVTIGVVIVMVPAMIFMVKNFYIKVEQGDALIINKTGGKTEVSFNGGLVYPVIHKAEKMDISLKTIELHRHGSQGLICADKIRADIQVTFYVQVKKDKDAVEQVAKAIGCRRASEQKTLETLFIAKFSEALKTVGYGMKFEELYRERDKFKEMILEEIGDHLNGYVLDAAAIDYLEQTPMESLDRDNVMDAEGIRSITELTAEKHVETNRLQNDEKKRITKQNVETREAVLALERQQAAAEASQAREVANVRAREKAEIEKVNAEELLKAQAAKIKTQEEVQVATENMNREVQVAGKNRERVVAVEHERVEKERMLTVIDKEREVELQTIAKQKAVEVEKKEIADVVRGRIAVEKTVAQEEELIKDLRVTKDAQRKHDVIVINAEAEAQEALVKDIKAAEAQEKAATHEAKKKLIMAEADLEAADKLAKAKQRLAEGTQAEVAAPGLAEVKVKEADAVALEKKGMVEARILKEKMTAEAVGKETQGLAEAKVREAKAEAHRREGDAAADVKQGTMLAEAKGDEEQGLAKARIEEANAAALQKRGQAEAVAIRERGTASAEAVELKLQAEAKGLADKAGAMKALDGVGREHEEYRINLEKEKEVELRGIDVKKDVALAQAKVLAQAFTNAKIDIVGGDGKFFDRFVDAVSLGKSIDGFVDRGHAARTVLDEYLSGEKSLPGDLKDILERPRLGSGDIQKLSISGLIAQLMTGKSGKDRTALTELMKKAQDLGIDELE